MLRRVLRTKPFACSGGGRLADEGVRLVSRLTGVAMSVPVVAGFVLLGAAVLVGRSLLDVGRRLLETKPRAREPLKAA